MKLKIKFRQFWWGVLVLFFSLIVFRLPLLESALDLEVTQRYIMFVVWIAILIAPVFSEIELPGLRLRQEFEKLRKDVLLHLQLRQNLTQNISLSTAMMGTEPSASSEVVPLSKRLYWLGNDLASLRFQAMSLASGPFKQATIEWQWQQVLEHARAVGLSPSLIRKLSKLIQDYLADPNLVRTETFAVGILTLQRDIAEEIAKKISNEALRAD